MNHSTPGLPIHHQLPEFTQTHVHRVSDAIQPSHPLSSPSPAHNPSQDQGLFQWVNSLHEVAKVLKCKSKPQWDITSHHSEGPSSRSLQTINAGDGLEQREYSCTVGGNVNWYSPYGRWYADSLKTRNKSTIWPRKPTPRHIPWGNQNWKDTCNPVVHRRTIVNAAIRVHVFA